MKQTVWLIVEAEADGKIIKHLIFKHFPTLYVEVFTATGGSPNLSRLESQLNDLIKRARKGTLKHPATHRDCILVVHDDDMIQPNRTVYSAIAQKCRSNGVVEIVASDELEAWLLSDSGLSKWLGIKQETWNSKQRPSDDLKSLLKAQKSLKYPDDLQKVLPHLNSDGINESFQDALKTLKTLPCTSA